MNTLIGKSYYTQKARTITYFVVRGWTLTDEQVMEQNKIDSDLPDRNGFFYNPKNKHWTFYYPSEFSAPSDHDKYVIFQHCRCTIDGSIHGEIEVHSTFIPRDAYCDSLVYYANLQPPEDNRKYQVNANRQTSFDVWFTNGRGQPYIDVEADLEHNVKEHKYDINFVLFMKLIY